MCDGCMFRQNQSKEYKNKNRRTWKKYLILLIPQDFHQAIHW